jgi:protein TonB
VFDNYVVDPKPSLRRRVLMATSIGLHVTAAVGLILYSVFHVEELAPPEIALTFFTAAPPPPPPPPPPAGGSTKKVEPKVTKVIKVPTTVTPLPKEDPTPAAKEEPAGEPGGVPGGVVGGVAGGVVGGVVGGVPTAAPPPPPPAPVAPKMVPSFVFDQQRIASPNPHLPSDFISRHPKQTINTTYRICVNTAGQVTEVTPVRGMNGVDETVESTVRTSWRWKPQPLPVCTIRNFQFQID